MRRVNVLVRVGILAMGSAFAIVPAAHADKSCSNATLNGTYGALIKGTAGGLPFAQLDIVTADGNGNLSGTGTSAYNGAITQGIPLSATYSIDSSCSATVSFSNGATQNAVITRDGEEVQFIRTDDPSAQVTGDAKRVDKEKCTDTALNGNFGATLGGEVGGLPYVALDSVTAGGDGAFSGTGTVSFNGAITDVSFTATYLVNPDCSGSVSFNTGATQNIVIVGRGSQVLILKTDNPNAVVTGVATNLSNHQNESE